MAGSHPPAPTARLRLGRATRPVGGGSPNATGVSEARCLALSRDSTASPERSPLENETGSPIFEMSWAVLLHLFRAEATGNLSVKFFTQVCEEQN